MGHPDPPSSVSQVSLDHLVLLTPGLSQGEASFREMGFQVTGGGTHVGGATGNRLVGFSDESYLELLTFFPAGNDPGPMDPASEAGHSRGATGAPPPGLSPMATRFWERAQLYGPIFDLALRVPDLEAVVRELRAHDIAVDDVVEGRRTREDGVELVWSMAFPRGRAFPFLIQDLTPWKLRVPHGSETLHTNGVNGVAEVQVPISPQEVSRLAGWSSVLGLPLNHITAPPGCWEVVVGSVRLSFHAKEEGNRDHGSRYAIVLRKGHRDLVSLRATMAQGLPASRGSKWELQETPSAG